MLAIAPNPALIRVALIVLFLVISQVLRAAKKSSSSTPASGSVPGKGLQIGEVLREAMRQASDQNRGQQSGQVADLAPLQGSEQIQLPPTTEPESSFVPSLLLLALLACLCLMAYRYWAR